jgi:hypothetical protein
MRDNRSSLVFASVLLIALFSITWSARPHREVLQKIFAAKDVQEQYQKDLPKILYHCQHHNVTLSQQEIGRVLKEEDCQVARFVSYYHSLAGPLVPSGSISSGSSGAGGKERVLKVETIPSDTTYATMFEDYLLKFR